MSEQDVDDGREPARTKTRTSRRIERQKKSDAPAPIRGAERAEGESDDDVELHASARSPVGKQDLAVAAGACPGRLPFRGG